jgi:hypothetical protein
LEADCSSKGAVLSNHRRNPKRRISALSQALFGGNIPVRASIERALFSGRYILIRTAFRA